MNTQYDMIKVERFLRWARSAKELDAFRKAAKLIGADESLDRIHKELLSFVESETLKYKVGGSHAYFYRTKHIPIRLPERKVFKDLLCQVKSEDVFYDLGSNRGLYSCLVGNKIEDGEVHAFEPNPVAVSDLKENVSLNGIENTVSVHEKAISERNDKVELKVKQNSTGNTIVGGEEGDRQVLVEAVPLDDYVKSVDIKRPTIMKIDIEGAEFYSTEHMKKCLINTRVVYLEVHKKRKKEGESIEEIYNVLDKIGFNKIEKFYERSEDHYIVRGKIE